MARQTTKWQIPYQGTVYVFDDASITASEARLQKRMTRDPLAGTPGLTPAEADEKREQLDPEPWVAALAIARRRAGLATEVAVDINGDDLDLMDILTRTRLMYEGLLAARRAEAAAESAPATAEPEPQVAPAPARSRRRPAQKRKTPEPAADAESTTS